MLVAIQVAEAQLSRLIEAALTGEEVIIAKGDMPVAKLVPLSSQTYRLGGGVGQAPAPPDDFFDPLDEKAFKE